MLWVIIIQAIKIEAVKCDAVINDNWTVIKKYQLIKLCPNLGDKIAWKKFTIFWPKYKPLSNLNTPISQIT